MNASRALEAYFGQGHTRVHGTSAMCGILASIERGVSGAGHASTCHGALNPFDADDEAMMAYAEVDRVIQGMAEPYRTGLTLAYTHSLSRKLKPAERVKAVEFIERCEQEFEQAWRGR